MPEMDATFLAHPFGALADAALSRALDLGASHAAFRLDRTRVGQLGLRDARVETTSDSVDLGLAVRVIVDGTWGFAASGDVTAEAAARVAEQAVAVAGVSRRLRAAGAFWPTSPYTPARSGSAPTTSTPSMCPRPSGSPG